MLKKKKRYLWIRCKEIHIRIIWVLAATILSKIAAQEKNRNFIVQASFICLGRELWCKNDTYSDQINMPY